MILIADVFPKLPSPKKVIRLMSAKSRFRGLFKKNMAKGYKEGSNLHNATFTKFVHPCEHNSVGKSLC